MGRESPRREATPFVAEDLDAAWQPSFDIARTVFEASMSASQAWSQSWAEWCRAAGLGAAAPEWSSPWATQANFAGAQWTLAAIEQARAMVAEMSRVWAPAVYDTSLPD